MTDNVKMTTKRLDDLPKTSKNVQQKRTKICSGVENVLLVERTAEPNQTSSSAKPRGSNSKTQKLTKNRIVYKKLYELTEIPDRRDVRAPCKPRSPNVEKMPLRHWVKCVEKPQHINCQTVMNEKMVEKSSVEPTSTVDKTKKETLIAPGHSLDEKSTASDVKSKLPKNNTKTSKNQRKKMSKICSRDTTRSKDSLTVKNSTSENETIFSDKQRTLKSQGLAKSRVKFVKLYELTEMPDRNNIRARCATRSPYVLETRTSSTENYVSKPELVNINRDLKQNVVVESSLEPINTVSAIKEEPITTTPIEKTTDVKIEKSEIAATKISKNQRKKILKMSSKGRISKEFPEVKNSSRENKTNTSDKPKTLDSETRNSRKTRIKFTKLYELTEIPEKQCTQSSTQRTLTVIEETHIGPRGKPVDKPLLVNSYKVLIEKESNKLSLATMAAVNQPKKKTISPIIKLGVKSENATTDVKTGTKESSCKTGNN